MGLDDHHKFTGQVLHKLFSQFTIRKLTSLSVKYRLKKILK